MLPFAFLLMVLSKSPEVRAVRSRVLSLWALILIGILLPACGVPDTEIQVVKIGLVAPFEGSFRDVGYDAIYAARLAVREINGTSGAARWRLELVAYDDRGDPGIAVQAARNLIVDPAVIAVIGHFRPETTNAAADVYASAGLPFIVLGGWGAPAETTWHLIPPPGSLTCAMRDLGEAGEDASPVVWGQAPGETTASRLQVVPDAGAPIDPDAPLVLSYLPPVAAGEMLLRWREAGWGGHLVGDWNLSASAFGVLAGTAATGTRFVTPYPYPAHVADTARWVADYQAMGPHVPAPGPYALPTYEALYTLAEALAMGDADAAGDVRQGVTREEVALALGQVDRTGWLGRIAWDDQHRWHEAPLYAYKWDTQGPILLGMTSAVDAVVP